MFFHFQGTKPSIRFGKIRKVFGIAIVNITEPQAGLVPTSLLVVCWGGNLVEVILKGLRKGKYGKESFHIATVKASVTLKNGGGIIVTLSNKSLSNKLKKCLGDDK